MHRALFPCIAGLLLLAGAGCSGTSSGDDDDDDTSTGPTDQDSDTYTSDVDCNDLDPNVHPGATEACNGLDDNCNSTTDEGFSLGTYYQDGDGDGYGSPSSTTQGCTAPSGYVTQGGDCDDVNGAIHPGAAETTCNGIDESCTSLAADSPDSDGDNYDACDVGVTGADSYPKDCNESSSAVSPGATETCNSLDDNCNSQIDEGVTYATYYQDSDFDTYGNPEATTTACSTPAGYVTNPDDCNDADGTAYPGAPETTGDGVDSNCDTYADTILGLAGTGTAGLAGDNGAAVTAQLNTPWAVSVDQRGDTYVADTMNNRVRKISATDGTIITFCGAGTAGDGSQAYAAQLVTPYGVTADGAGNIYISDTGKNVIRKVNPNGIISTIAGSGQTDDGAGGVGDGGLPTQGHLDFPTGLALDLSGNLYIADTNHHRIRMVSNKPQGQTISTFAGTGVEGSVGDNGNAAAAQLSEPHAVHVDSTGAVYIADSGNHKIRKVNLTGKISTVAGTGTAGYNGDGIGPTTAQLSYPTAMSTNLTTTELYIADSGNNRIRKVVFGAQGAGTISTVAGTGTAGYSGDDGSSIQAKLNSPQGLAIGPQGNMAIADTKNHSVRVVVW